MAEFGYSYTPNEKAKFARAQAHDVDVSYKQLVNVCNDVKGMLAETAVAHLQLVAEGLQPVRFRKFAKHVGHRRELGGKRGRYPKKAALRLLQVLKNAVANANSKGLQSPYIAHICANKQATLPRLAPKGRRSQSDYETSKVEIVLEEYKPRS